MFWQGHAHTVLCTHMVLYAEVYTFDNLLAVSCCLGSWLDTNAEYTRRRTYFNLLPLLCTSKTHMVRLPRIVRRSFYAITQHLEHESRCGFDHNDMRK